MTNYGPWKLWDGVVDITQADVAIGDTDRSTVAYREVIETEVLTHSLKAEYHGEVRYGKITITGLDTIKAEWVD